MDPKAPSLESKIQILVSCRSCPMPDVLVLPLRLWSWKSLKKKVDIVDTPMVSIWNLLLSQAQVFARTVHPQQQPIRFLQLMGKKLHVTADLQKRSLCAMMPPCEPPGRCLGFFATVQGLFHTICAWLQDMAFTHGMEQYTFTPRGKKLPV